MWTPRTSAGSDIVFAAQTHNGIFAVDCSDPAKPKTLDRWTFPLADHPEWPSCCIGSIAVGDGCVYVAGLGCSVQAIPAKGAAKETFRQGEPPKNADFREPYPTDEKEFYVWKPAKPGQARAVALRSGTEAGTRASAFVYAACGDAGLHVLKIRPEGGFDKIGELAGHPTVFDVQVEGNRLYTAEGLEGWAVYEMDGVASFREVARRKWLDDKRDPALCVWKPRPGFVVLSTRRNGVSVFDEKDLNAERPLVRVGGSPGWDKYLSVQRGQFVRPLDRPRREADGAFHRQEPHFPLERHLPVLGEQGAGDERSGISLPRSRRMRSGGRFAVDDEEVPRQLLQRHPARV